MTTEESRKLIEKYIPKGQEALLGIKNHRKIDLQDYDSDRLFRFTARIMSFDFLLKLKKSRKIKNVFYSPSFTPPGGSPDSISLRFKIYIEYH